MRTPTALLALAAATLLAAGCSRPNPGWVDDGATSGGSASGGETLSSGPSTSAAATTTTTAGETSSVSTTTSEGSSGVTTETLPACGPLDGGLIQIDGVNDQKLCEGGVEFYGKITNDGVNPPLVELCLFGQCDGCTGFSVVLQPEAGWIPDGSCLTLAHEGIWVPGDPEAPGGCKTTGVLLYLENDLKYPVYIASSRVFTPPAGLEASLDFTVEPVNKVTCSCAMDGCCVADGARTFDLLFAGDLTVAAGTSAAFQVGEALYAVEALRAHRRTYEAEGACHGPIDFVDWQMVRLSP